MGLTRFLRSDTKDSMLTVNFSMVNNHFREQPSREVLQNIEKVNLLSLF